MSGSPDRDLSPTKAAEWFVARREKRNTDHTVRSYCERLKEFVFWADERDIESMSEIDGWLLDEYRRYLETKGNAAATIKGKLVSIKQLLAYCAKIDVVDEELPEKVDMPTLSEAEETSDQMLAAEDARELLTFYRSSTEYCGKSW